jgi:hypothetical protein
MTAMAETTGATPFAACAAHGAGAAFAATETAPFRTLAALSATVMGLVVLISEHSHDCFSLSAMRLRYILSAFCQQPEAEISQG